MTTSKPTTTPILLRVPDAARVLGIGRSMAYALIAAGEIEVVHIGSVIRVPLDALESFVERRRAIPSEGEADGR